MSAPPLRNCPSHQKSPPGFSPFRLPPILSASITISQMHFLIVSHGVSSCLTMSHFYVRKIGAVRESLAGILQVAPGFFSFLRQQLFDLSIPVFLDPVCMGQAVTDSSRLSSSSVFFASHTSLLLQALTANLFSVSVPSSWVRFRFLPGEGKGGL